MSEQELDVRPLRKPDKHPTIFNTYDALAAGESFVLCNDHDPKPLRDEFDREHPGSYTWDYVETGPQQWRVRIGKLTSTSLPRVLCDTTGADQGEADAAGVVWKLETRDRDLDSNVVRLSAGDSIDAHAGPDLDVLIHVLGGDGWLGTERGVIELAPGMLVWLPRRSRREFTAGEHGLRYLTVHQRRRELALDTITTRQPE